MVWKWHHDHRLALLSMENQRFQRIVWIHWHHESHPKNVFECGPKPSKSKMAKDYITRNSENILSTHCHTSTTAPSSFDTVIPPPSDFQHPAKYPFVAFAFCAASTSLIIPCKM